MIADIEKKTSVEIAIVTVDTSMTTKEKFDAYILQLHNVWGVGKKEKDNGIVIGFSAAYRKVRISNGEGIVPQLSDSATQQIIDKEMIPSFKKGAYFDGLVSGLKALMTIGE